MKTFSKKITVKYSDIDFSGNFSLKALMTYLQDIAGCHSSSVGYGYADIPNTHVTWLVLDWKVQLLKQPDYNTELTISTWPRTLDKFYSYRDFEVYDANKNLIALASSKWLLYNTQEKRIARVTEDIVKAFPLESKSAFDKPLNERPKEPSESSLEFECTIQRRDIDTNEHVNNLHYIDYAMEALPEEIYKSNQFTTVEIHYKKEIKYKDTIRCFYSFRNNKHVVTIKSKDGAVVHSIVKLY